PAPLALLASPPRASSRTAGLARRLPARRPAWSQVGDPSRGNGRRGGRPLPLSLLRSFEASGGNAPLSSRTPRLGPRRPRQARSPRPGAAQARGAPKDRHSPGPRGRASAPDQLRRNLPDLERPRGGGVRFSVSHPRISGD